MPVQTRILTHHTVTFPGSPLSAATILDDDARGNVTLSNAQGNVTTFDVVHLDSVLSLLHEVVKLNYSDPQMLADPISVPHSPFALEAAQENGKLRHVTLLSMDGPVVQVAAEHITSVIEVVTECRNLRDLMSLKGDDLLVGGDPDSAR